MVDGWDDEIRWLGVRKAYGMSLINCVVRLSNGKW